jgi:hypothetical protein
MLIAEHRHSVSAAVLHQQRIADVLMPLAADIQDDSPALAPVIVYAMNDDGLVSCDRGALALRIPLASDFAVSSR